MSDFDIRCVNCFHRSHENKECPYCDPKNRCQEFVRADLFIARSIVRIEGFLQQSHGQLIMALSTVFDLLAEAYPEAAESLSVKLKERQAATQAAMEAQQAETLKEADTALGQARAVEEDKAMEELAEGYGKVLQFPTTASEGVANSPGELAGCDTDPEIV